MAIKKEILDELLKNTKDDVFLRGSAWRAEESFGLAGSER